MDKRLKLIQFILSRLDGGVADLWKIYKLMYFIDFESFKKHKKSVSDAEYYNWKYGPLPYRDTQEYAQKNLIEKGATEKLWHLLGDDRVQLNAEKVDSDDLTEEEKNVAEEVLGRYRALSGNELVAISHEDMPWKMTKEFEKIEYDYVLWRDTEEDRVEDITEKIFA